MSARLVSVIIPCYNTGRFLGAAIMSALDQSHAAVEVVVVDDGSTDESAPVAAGFEGRGVRCIRQRNAGVGAARNRGIAESRGEHLVFLDADDRLLSSAIETGVRELEARPECGFVYGFSRPISAAGAVMPHAVDTIERADYALLLGGRGVLPPAVAMFRRRAVERVGGFRQEHFPTEDHDFYLRVAREFPIHCHNQVVAEYRLHEDNACRISPARTLASVLRTVEAQRPWVRGNPELEGALERGRRHWEGIFGPHLSFEIMGSLKRGRFRQALRALRATLRHYPRGLLEYPAHRVKRLLGRRRGAKG